jgi:hypothetical protein
MEKNGARYFSRQYIQHFIGKMRAHPHAPLTISIHFGAKAPIFSILLFSNVNVVLHLFSSDVLLWI